MLSPKFSDRPTIIERLVRLVSLYRNIFCPFSSTSENDWIQQHASTNCCVKILYCIAHSHRYENESNIFAHYYATSITDSICRVSHPWINCALTCSHESHWHLSSTDLWLDFNWLTITLQVFVSCTHLWWKDDKLSDPYVTFAAYYVTYVTYFTCEHCMLLYQCA